MRNHRALVNRARKTTETLIATDVTEKIIFIISVESVVLSALSGKNRYAKSQKTANLTRTPAGVRLLDLLSPGVCVADAPQPRANSFNPSGIKRRASHRFIATSDFLS